MTPADLRTASGDWNFWRIEVFLLISFQDMRQACSFLESAQPLDGKFLTLVAQPRDMLHAMQQPTASAPAATSPSFAALLATLAAPAQSPGDRPLPEEQRPASAWSDDDLADDVATLSYESALKAHARYHPTDQSLTQAASLSPFCFDEASSALSAAAPQPASRAITNHLPRAAANLTPESNRLPSAPLERNLKDASITIRMSKAECAQLHERAAEAGLTVSAYLRSCTLEAESLRAMVKDALAQLRSETIQTKAATPATPSRSLLGRLTRRLAGLLPHGHNNQRVARV
jgi:predicted DNA binding CopG/RHH family protein